MGGLPINTATWDLLLKECDKNNDGMVLHIYIYIYIFFFFLNK